MSLVPCIGCDRAARPVGGAPPPGRGPFGLAEGAPAREQSRDDEDQRATEPEGEKEGQRHQHFVVGAAQRAALGGAQLAHGDAVAERFAFDIEAFDVFVERREEAEASATAVSVSPACESTVMIGTPSWAEKTRRLPAPSCSSSVARSPEDCAE